MAELVKLSQEDLRQLQLIELEMIVEVDRICKKYNIQYSLDGGTLLGAVRHKGFIPWDDDADVIFTRKEYAKFYKACKQDLDTSRFFLQEYRTDPYYRWGYAKLRRKDTEFIRLNQEAMRYKTGVCIDVFVNDNVPDNIVARKLYYALNFCIRKVLYSELGKTQENNWMLRQLYKVLFFIPRDPMFKLRNIFASMCNKHDTELKSHLLYPYPKKESKYGMPSECFEEYIDMEFEGMKFKVFKQYDRYLRLLYGNYMELPPVEKRKGPGEASCVRLLGIGLEQIQERYKRDTKERNR